MDMTKILIQTIFSFAQSLLEIPQGRRKAAKTQRKTSNLSITSCKSLNPGYPDSDNIEYSFSRKDAKENQQFINNIL